MDRLQEFKMTYTFNTADVNRVIAESILALEFRKGGQFQWPQKPAALLCGDQGVYLCSNRVPDGTIFVAYAEECNPTLVGDEWWDNKRKGFGADDGVDFIPIQDVQGWARTNKKQITMEFTDPGVWEFRN
jgi:hypothetical protein